MKKDTTANYPQRGGGPSLSRVHTLGFPLENVFFVLLENGSAILT